MERKRKPQILKAVVVWCLICSILLQSIPVYAWEGLQDIRDKWEAIFEENVSVTDTRVIDSDNDMPMKGTPSQTSWKEQDHSKEETGEEEEFEPTLSQVKTLFDHGRIRIYNLEQLYAIGTDQVVTTGDACEETFGFGDEILYMQATQSNANRASDSQARIASVSEASPSEADWEAEKEDVFGKREDAVWKEGEAITYSLDADYELVHEIALNAEEPWTLPKGFTGTFSREPKENAMLYEKESDTIYIYNNYQLLLVASEDAQEEPVLSNDMIPELVGMGHLLYSDASPSNASGADAQNYLTYSTEHHYVLSMDFTEQMPKLEASEYAKGTVTEEQIAGRDYIGQVYTTIGDEKYILIGNEQQLRAIGSGKQVTPMLFLKTEAKLLLIPLGTKIVPYYPGDADLNLDLIEKTGIPYQDIQEGTQEFQYLKKNKELMNVEWGSNTLLGEVTDVVSGLLGGILGSLVGSQELVGLKIETDGTASIGAGRKKYTSFAALKAEYQELTYAVDANYIVFRDIDLESGDFSNGEDDDWTPIHFSGVMQGQKNMEEGNIPTISNIHVHQSGLLNMKTTSGIGFFGTISNQLDVETFASAKEVRMKDLRLQNVNIQNDSTKVDTNTDSLIEGVTGLLGGILGGVLDLLNPLIGNLKLADVVRELLTLKKDSPDLFATGSFAGRIIGQVSIENCEVVHAQVKSKMGYSGGFVGYTEGAEQYDGLSGALGTAVKTLASLLNVIPGVGLGDLITILLENDIPLGNLVPIGYYNPILKNCRVRLEEGEIGTIGTNYNGGFVGMQIGTILQNCAVEGLHMVYAKNGAGGFAGAERDAVIRGLLNDLGVQLYTLDARSVQENCTVTGAEVLIQAEESYAGGFNGLMANSESCDSSIKNLAQVTAEKYAGGFAGRATIGYATIIGTGQQEKASLLSSVSKLLVQVVASGNSEQLNTLLSLSGVMPSRISGCTVDSDELSVSAKSYAAGLIGQGDGVKILGKTEQDFGAKVSGLTSVQAKDSYAGAIAGSLVTADAIGVLNNTIGVGHYVPFELSDITVEGKELSIKAGKKYAGGAAGLMLGGSVTKSTISELANVSSGNYAGGFAGRVGASGLASAGGLDILGLVKIDNVLSLAEGMRVTIQDCLVTGSENGLRVNADAKVESTDGEDIVAGGFLGEAVAAQVTRSHVKNVREITAEWEKKEEKTSEAGGFVGRSHTGGLAGLAQEDTDGSLKLPGIIQIDSLLNLVPYLIPNYIDTTVSFISNGKLPQVRAHLAGGFVGEMQSGIVDNTQWEEAYAVYGLEFVQGESYAGGFGAKVNAGATASSDGLKLLSGLLKLNVSDLFNVLNIYVPVIRCAGVRSAEGGFCVSARETDSSAGGYIGYGSGVQITSSDVNSLRHTKVTPPKDSLESSNASSYFDSAQSEYAVFGGKYAGGYIGRIDIDSAASVGGGLSLLDTLNLDHILGALDLVDSKIEESNVFGCVGGFSVLAFGENSKAGGYVGEMAGAQIKTSDVDSFAYIIARGMAGGYAAEMKPGNVASVLENSSILDGVLNVGDNLASLIQAFIPKIEDSSTRSIPCGGAVRAQKASGLEKLQIFRKKKDVQSRFLGGIAGGYVGYNHGGRITGRNRESAAIRIRSVYGEEYAGGFTGLMETADLTGTGNLSLLYSLLETSNVLSLLGAIYPIQTNTAVYGPLRKLDMETWNAWAAAVGANGVYGDQFPTSPVDSQEELDALIRKYAYGYNVKASDRGNLLIGVAGGYIGKMKGGVITDTHAWDVKSVLGYQSSGGFAGKMVTGGVAEIGKISLLGLPITGAISAVQTFIPVIRNSDVTGFQSGLRVKAIGIARNDQNLKVEEVGYAGGYVGHMVGGQIWGNWQDVSLRSATDAIPDPKNRRCFVANLRQVEGTNRVGGYAGRIEPASAAALDTASSDGLLGGLLQNLITTPNDLLSLLNATVSTVRGAQVSAWDDWGIVVNGAYGDGSKYTAYAKAVGGFAGEINGAVIGEKGNHNQGVSVTNLRSVIGGEYAGGFFGLADVSAVAEVSGEENTSILGNLIGLGSVDVLDAFRTYIYDSSVVGTANAGLEVQARDARKQEYVNHPVYTGTAGGFGGSLLNGSVADSKVANLREVSGQNYSGGFIGHLGKSGVVDVDQIGALHNLLQLGAGILDVFGSHVENSSVEGMDGGFTVTSYNTLDHKNRSEIAGGFSGYADLAKLSGNDVKNLKQVASREVAGGFVGQTSFAYLADIKADSALVKPLLQAFNQVLKTLWVADLEKGQTIKIDLGLLSVDALYDGELVHLKLFGLDVKIALAKEKQLATVYIGDSKIELNCANNGEITNADALKDEINISLIKANRTRIENCTVVGIKEGYDIYGGGAGNTRNGSGNRGYAGGFVGLNDEGLLKKNQMYFADVIRGTKGLVGPFTGASSLESSWDFNTIFAIEGEENDYRVYRDVDPDYKQILGNGKTPLQESLEQTDSWNIYTIRHLAKVKRFTDFKNAMLSDGTQERELLVYQEDGAKAVLMKDTPTDPTLPGDQLPTPDAQDPCTEYLELQIQKIWKNDKEKERPEMIRLQITRTYEMDGETIRDEHFLEEIRLTFEEAITANVWERILFGERFPAYRVGEDGKKYDYTYQITEDALDGYQTNIQYQGEHHDQMIVINKKNPAHEILPDTGGKGTARIYMVGVLLWAAYGIMEYRKRRCPK